MDPVYNPTIIPTLYSKIGALTVRMEMLMVENEDLRAMVEELKEEKEGQGSHEDQKSQ